MDTIMEAGQSFSSRIGYMLPESLEAAWPYLLAIMKAHPEGLLDGFFNEGDVFAAIATNRYDVWLGMDEELENVQLAALCRLEKYEAFSIYRICWVGGKMGPLFSAGLKKIEAYAANVLKAEKVAFDCRKGLVRLAEPLGYKIFRYEVWKSIQRSN